jgi:hypothetical protein
MAAIENLLHRCPSNLSSQGVEPGKAMPQNIFLTFCPDGKGSLAMRFMAID